MMVEFDIVYTAWLVFILAVSYIFKAYVVVVFKIHCRLSAHAGFTGMSAENTTVEEECLGFLQGDEAHLLCDNGCG